MALERLFNENFASKIFKTQYKATQRYTNTATYLSTLFYLSFSTPKRVNLAFRSKKHAFHKICRNSTKALEKPSKLTLFNEIWAISGQKSRYCGQKSRCFFCKLNNFDTRKKQVFLKL